MFFIQLIIITLLFDKICINCFQFNQHYNLFNNRLYRLKHSNKIISDIDILRQDLIQSINTHTNKSIYNIIHNNLLLSNNINKFINNSNSNNNMINILSNWGNNKIENIFDGTWLINNNIITNKSDEYLSILHDYHMNNNNITIKHYFNSSIGIKF